MQERAVVDAQRAILAMVAPGTPLRAGLERILAGRTGALIVMGADRSVEALCDGGFRVDLEFSPTRVRELAKMDGAVLLNADASRILGANIQLMPDPRIPTVESGTRHRTAERVGLQTGHPVIAVSHSMGVISLYHGGRRHEVSNPSTILDRANQALATLHRYRTRLDEVIRALSLQEIEDTTTLRDALTALQRLLMVRRIAEELTGNVVELGTEGRLLGLQLEELVSGTEGLRELLIQDYLPADHDRRPLEEVCAALDGIDDLALLDLAGLARELGYPIYADGLDVHVSPRGHRLLSNVPRVPPTVLDRLIGHFESLQGLLAATAEDLQSVDGIGEARARTLREGLARMAEFSLADRYHSLL